MVGKYFCLLKSETILVSSLASTAQLQTIFCLYSPVSHGEQELSEKCEYKLKAMLGGTTVKLKINKLGLSWAKLSYQLGLGCSLIKICCIILINTK